MFYELGIRTALNKPVAYVTDDRTTDIPFDTGVINHHIYKAIPVYNELDQEKKKLIEHIRLSLDSSQDTNTTWQLFGLETARLRDRELSEDEQVTYLTSLLEAFQQENRTELRNLRQTIDQSVGGGQLLEKPRDFEKKGRTMLNDLEWELERHLRTTDRKKSPTAHDYEHALNLLHIIRHSTPANEASIAFQEYFPLVEELRKKAKLPVTKKYKS